MADWTQLPGDLLHLISKRLHSPLDVVRFRSVCSTWRSLITFPGLHRLAPSFLFIPANDGPWKKSSDYFTLSKRIVFLIGSSKASIQTEPSTPWIIKIEHVRVPTMIRFLNPLSKSVYDSFPYNFPKGFNSLDFRVLQLGEEYVIDIYNRKVVLSCSDCNVNDFVLLSVSDYGRLAMLKSSDQRWTKIHRDTSFRRYDDVIFYKGNFYAVDSDGRTLVVGLDSETSVVGEPVGVPVNGGRRKYLVESKGELFLVAMYSSLVIGRPRVFKFDEVGKEWIEVNNLNDRVLFLGIGCAFAALAEDLSVCRGNFIVFVNSIKPSGAWDVRVFDLVDGSIRPLWKFPQLDKLFSPPSSWISGKKSWKDQIAEKKKQITNKISKLVSFVTKERQPAATRSRH
ncbi:hypothetical protein PTKIN_Ptkin10aG0167500 [Pterospermum kingtungense]